MNTKLFWQPQLFSGFSLRESSVILGVRPCAIISYVDVCLSLIGQGWGLVKKRALRSLARVWSKRESLVASNHWWNIPVILSSPAPSPTSYPWHSEGSMSDTVKMMASSLVHESTVFYRNEPLFWSLEKMNSLEIFQIEDTSRRSLPSEVAQYKSKSF